MNKECVFCNEGSDFSYSKSFLGDNWPFQNRVVYSDDYVFAIVGYSPQVCPYILIIPYRHIYSVAQMNKIELQAFINCLQFLSSSGAYSSSLCFFEHGGSSEDGSSSIDHCHVHVIDNSTKFYNSSSFTEFKKIHRISDLQIYSKAYYLVGIFSEDKLEMKAQEDNRHEHQYFRKVLAECLGEKQWNWKLDMRFDMMVNSMKLFRNANRKEVR